MFAKLVILFILRMDADGETSENQIYWRRTDNYLHLLIRNSSPVRPLTLWWLAVDDKMEEEELNEGDGATNNNISLSCQYADDYYYDLVLHIFSWHGSRRRRSPTTLTNMCPCSVPLDVVISIFIIMRNYYCY